MAKSTVRAALVNVHNTCNELEAFTNADQPDPTRIALAYASSLRALHAVRRLAREYGIDEAEVLS